MPERDWKRLGAYIVARRTRLGYQSRAALARAAGLSRPTILKIERGAGAGTYDATLSDIEHALRWEPGSTQRILDGGEPASLADTPAAQRQQPEFTEAAAMSDREFDELARDSIRLAPIMRKTHGDKWTDQYLRRLVDVAMLRDRAYGEHLARILGVASTTG